MIDSDNNESNMRNKKRGSKGSRIPTKDIYGERVRPHGIVGSVPIKQADQACDFDRKNWQNFKPYS